MDIAHAVGLPEARLALADAVVLVATSPKSNSAHDAINAAIADVQAGHEKSTDQPCFFRCQNIILIVWIMQLSQINLR